MTNSTENKSKSFKEVEFEFHTRNDVPTSIWVEPSCQNIDVEPGFDYKLVANENCFRIEFDKNMSIILYLQYSNEYKLFKRDYSNDFRKEWVLEYDLADL